MIRKEKKYTVEEVLKHTSFENRGPRVDFDGDMIKMGSQRYRLFLKSCTCATCGIEGTYFLKEKCDPEYPYHFNLYAINSDGNEVLITKDHIVPKSLGGKNQMNNYQTMCAECNTEKGNNI